MKKNKLFLGNFSFCYQSQIKMFLQNLSSNFFLFPAHEKVLPLFFQFKLDRLIWYRLLWLKLYRSIKNYYRIRGKQKKFLKLIQSVLYGMRISNKKLCLYKIWIFTCGKDFTLLLKYFYCISFILTIIEFKFY